MSYDIPHTHPLMLLVTRIHIICCPKNGQESPPLNFTAYIILLISDNKPAYMKPAVICDKLIKRIQCLSEE